MKQVVVSAGVRRPVGRCMGSLKDVQRQDLAALVLNEAVRRAGIAPEMVAQVIMGAYQSGQEEDKDRRR